MTDDAARKAWNIGDATGTADQAPPASDTPSRFGSVDPVGRIVGPDVDA
jgi:hypothetical protein